MRLTSVVELTLQRTCTCSPPSVRGACRATLMEPSLEGPESLRVRHPDAILVNPRQQGNSVFRYLSSARWIFCDIVPDFVCGSSTAVLFLRYARNLVGIRFLCSSSLIVDMTVACGIIAFIKTISSHGSKNWGKCTPSESCCVWQMF